VIYSPLAVGRDQGGVLVCTTCGGDLDPDTGKCCLAQTIDAYLATAMADALDRWQASQAIY
jgi:hypothetical protein